MNEIKAMERGWLFRRIVRIFGAYSMGIGGPEHINKIKSACAEMEDDLSKQIITATTTASEVILRSVFEEMDKRFHQLVLTTEMQQEEITKNKVN